MKFKLKIEREVNIQQNVLEKKIETYLINNFYSITERGANYIMFSEDEFSDRKRSRSDVHKRIGGGKFLFGRKTDNGICIQLIYFTSISYYLSIVILVCTFGIYTENVIMPIIFSIVLALPFLAKILYLNEHVFSEILES